MLRNPYESDSTCETAIHNMRRSFSISLDGHIPCCSMPAWEVPGNNTQFHALLMPTWAHDGPGCMDSHGTAWSPPHGHGLVRVQVSMAARTHALMV